MQVNRSSAFTLVEVLIIAPVVVLLIGVFIGLVVNLTGESLVIKERNDAIYDVQATLDEMETSISQATGFLGGTGTLTTPQGRNNDTTAFSHIVSGDGTSAPSGFANTLIMTAAATTASPLSSSRSLIYTGAGACNYQNPIYQYRLIYFVKSSTLYKRTIIVPTPACANPWQRNSCSEASKPSYPAVCKAIDEKLLDDVSSLSIEYYAGSNSSQPLPVTDVLLANNVKVTINYSRQAAGSTIASNSTFRITSLNAQAAAADNTAPPAAPTEITYAWNDTSNPYRTTFSWQPSGNATGYNIRYRVSTPPGNGTMGSWVDGPQNTTSTTYNIDGTYRRQNIEIEVKALSASGDFYYPNLTVMIPRWNDCGYQNGWTSYGGGYNSAGFTKTYTRMVGLKGLVSHVNTGPDPTGINDNLPICTLPPGFRPANRLIFQVETYPNTVGRIDILANGEVHAILGDNPWISLDGIIFPPSDNNTITWNTGTWMNGWTNYSGYAPFRYGLDGLNRVHVEGLGQAGTLTSGTVMSNSLTGASYRPSHMMHMPSQGYTSSALSLPSTGALTTRGVGNNYNSVQFLYYPNTFSSWNNLTLQNSWVNYDSVNYSPAQCYKANDDITIVRGLIKTGASGTIATNVTSAGCGTFSAGQLLLHGWMSANSGARIDINTSGGLGVTVGSSTWTSIDQIHFISDS